jgi:hypothetical protein
LRESLSRERRKGKESIYTAKERGSYILKQLVIFPQNLPYMEVAVDAIYAAVPDRNVIPK